MRFTLHARRAASARLLREEEEEERDGGGDAVSGSFSSSSKGKYFLPLYGRQTRISSGPQTGAPLNSSLSVPAWDARRLGCGASTVEVASSSFLSPGSVQKGALPLNSWSRARRAFERFGDLKGLAEGMRPSSVKMSSTHFSWRAGPSYIFRIT